MQHLPEDGAIARRNNMRCKLTDKHDRTFGGCQWGEGVIHETPGEGELCGPGWIHFYEHPLLAVLLNPIHGNFDLETAHLWEIESTGREKTDHGLKTGGTKVTTLHKIDLPRISPEAAVAFGIFAALEVNTDPDFVTWANNWLSGVDRSEKSARAAAEAWAARAWARAWAAAEAARAWAAAEAAAAARAARAASLTKTLDLISLAEKAVAMFPYEVDK